MRPVGYNLSIAKQLVNFSDQFWGKMVGKSPIIPDIDQFPLPGFVYN